MMKRKQHQNDHEDEEIQVQENNQPTPNISLQLISCFLTLNELAVVARCSNQWYKAVTRKEFFNMYKNGENGFDFNGKNFPSFCSSPFRYILRSLSFSNKKLGIANLNFIPQLKKLNSLSLELDLSLEENIIFDYLATFRLFPRSMRKLELYVERSDASGIWLSQLTHAMSSLVQINELHIREKYGPMYINNYSIISSLINLENLIIDRFQLSHRDSIIAAVRSLPKLREFNVNCVIYNEIMIFLRNLCAQPGAPPFLMQIPTIAFIKDGESGECAQLLSQLPSLKHIRYDWDSNCSVPTVLAPLVKFLDISCSEITENDIDTIISMPQLSKLTISDCAITETQFERLFNKIGKQLNDLSLFELYFKPMILFDVLSKYCFKLETLSIDLDCQDLVPFSSCLFQLKSFQVLQSLKITISGDWQKYEKAAICNQFTAILNPPCSIIPSLKKFKIETEIFDRRPIK
jgi:hypothetical protein